VIPVDQTVLRTPDDPTGPPGNCFAACIASILECSIDDVPHPTVDERDGEGWTRPGGYWERLGAWLASVGYYSVEIIGKTRPWTTLDLELPGVYSYAIAHGDGPRGCKHSIVVRLGELCGDELAHDPHPSRSGLLRNMDGVSRISGWTLLVPMRPSLHRSREQENGAE
jgi:hypothetical protein